MGSFTDSLGRKVSKAKVNENVYKAKGRLIESQREEHGYNFCELCKTSQGYLDCSHTVSVNDCQKMPNIALELAWDEVANLRVLCRQCHIKHDSISRL
jgi:hypothetical protein